MEYSKSNSIQGLAIAALVLGVIALVIAFIPCVGIAAVFPGIIAIVLSIVALNQASRENSNKGLVITALVISIVATSVSSLWSFYFGKKIKQGLWLKQQIENAIEVENNKTFDSDSKKFDNDMEIVLKNLEDSVNKISIKVEIKNHMSDSDFDAFIANYEKLINEAIKYKIKSESGNKTDIELYTQKTLKLNKLLTEIATSSSKLNSSQIEKLKEINKKYEKELNDISGE